MHTHKSRIYPIAWTIFLLTCLTLPGCTPQKISAPTAVQAKKAVQPATPLPSLSIPPIIQPTPSRAPTQTIPTSTSTPALPPESILKTHCLDLASELPSKANLSGSLIVNYQKINLATGITTPLDEKYQNAVTWQYFASPDGEWLAHMSMDSQSGPYVIALQSASGHPQIRISLLNDKMINLFGWLDNKHLIATHYWTNRPASTLVINPFTGQRVEFFLENLIGYPTGDQLFFHSSNLLPDPTLSLIVYPRFADDGKNIVLWDPKHKNVLGKVTDLYSGNNDPIWSQDGKDFLIATALHETPSNNSSTGPYPIYEWSRVTRDGQVSQLTHFADYFKMTEIDQSSRSPDGRYVAFLFYDSPDLDHGQWMVLDIEAKSVVNYCLPGSIKGGYFVPVWSPDSRYLVVENVNHDFKGPVYIVDLVDIWAAQIAKDTAPQAWWNGQ